MNMEIVDKTINMILGSEMYQNYLKTISTQWDELNEEIEWYQHRLRKRDARDNWKKNYNRDYMRSRKK